MRRLCWLVLGAVLGVTGYRRATRRLSALLRPGRGSGRTAAARARADQSGGQPAGPAPARGDGRRRAPGRTRAMAREVGLSASAFLHDAREGMEDYLDRHAADLSPAPAVPRGGHGRRDEAGGSCAHPGTDYAKDGH